MLLNMAETWDGLAGARMDQIAQQQRMRTLQSVPEGTIALPQPLRAGRVAKPVRAPRPMVRSVR
jgi:hypothetical protein